MVEVLFQIVVVFELVVIDMLDVLGVEIVGVFVFGLFVFLVDVMNGIDIMGSLFEFDFEKLVIFGLDLIIVGGWLQDKIDDLFELVLMFDMIILGIDLVEILKVCIVVYGEIFGKQDEVVVFIVVFDNIFVEV